MKNKTNEELQDLVAKATAGDKKALETLIAGVQDIIFNMSLRMLGTFADAEDATQDILLKMITHLSSFRGDSSFTTWVFRIAANHLKNYKKHMFARYPLNFEYYGNDIENAKIDDVPDLTQNVETDILAEELKLSCTNVMLQCLDMESRCIFILGTMFQIDSRIAADFLAQYCGEYGSGRCKCRDRVNYAIQSHRLNPLQLDYVSATEIPIRTMMAVKNAMEDIDNLSQDFSFCKPYQSPEHTRHLIQEFLDSTQFSTIQNA